MLLASISKGVIPMAHNLMQMSNGKASYVGRKAGWHELGTVIGDHFTWQDTLDASGLNFSVFKSQLNDGMGRKVDAYGTFRWDKEDQAAGAKDKTIFLGCVGGDYKVIQHSNGFEMVDALMNTVDGAHYETCGVLGQGQRVWGLADLNKRVRIGGNDEINVYLLFSTSHDGSASYNFRMVTERVVCENTLEMAMAEKTRASFTIRHTKNSHQRVIDAHAAVVGLDKDVTRMEDMLNFLAQRKMNREAMVSILDKLFPKTVKAIDETETEQSSTRRDNILADVLKVYEINDGNAFPEQRGTAYNLLNAVTEYTDHVRTARSNETTSSNQARATSALFGTGNTLKSKALDVIYQTAQGLDVVARKTLFVPPAPISAGSSLLDSIVDLSHA